MGGCSSKPHSAAHSTMDTFNPFATAGDAHSRCNHMLKESAALAKACHKYEKDLAALQTAMTVAFESNNVVCATPIPGIYNDTNAVAASAAVGSSEPMGGPGYSLGNAQQGKGDLSTRLANDTTKVIKDWTTRYQDALVHQKAVDKAYDALEAARKAVTAKKEAVEKIRLRIASDPKAEGKVAAEEAALQGLAAKLSVAETNHTNLEAAQHQRVTALNRDSIKIRGALRNALATIGAATTACAEHITDTNVAAPAVPAAVGVGVAGR